jgi:hypothetical protein
MIKKIGINNAMVLNRYEKMVPFNLWFKHPKYKILDYYENNQHIRIRYYNDVMLTPLVSNKMNNLCQIMSFLPLMSLYQPFYPETFYAFYEFLHTRHLNLGVESFLCICREERLGIMEAIVLYNEKYQTTYQNNTYHVWIVGEEEYKIMDNSYSSKNIYPNYLEQVHRIVFIQSTNNFTSYDFICIDCISLFDDFFEWNSENMDLQTNLFYLLLSLSYLKKNGSMIIRLNMIGSKSWYIIFSIASTYFIEYTFYRPSTLNPYNSEIYLFLNKFRYDIQLGTIQNLFYKNLYRWKAYDLYYLNIKPDIKNSIYHNFLLQVKKWLRSLKTILGKKPVERKDIMYYITEWHRSHGMRQIGDLTNNFEVGTVRLCFSNLDKRPVFKPTGPYILYSQPSYLRLLDKKAELNSYKRVLDTKPNLTFTNRRTSKKVSSLLTWEELTNTIDIYRNLKYILVSQYHAESVTNAWIKMYEMLNLFHDIIPKKEVVKTFHICEAPGAFISATNHYLSNRHQELDWYAQTLKPRTDECHSKFALDDYFGLIGAYPNRWIFGDPKIDDSGNITHAKVIRSYASNPLLKNLDFITADAGLKCDPKDLNEQESILCKTNMGQIICILACLPIGKSAIFKTFIPITEPLNISMLYLLTYLFTEVILTKPSTSHGSNSEIYILLKEYRGINTNLLEMLFTALESPKITSKSSLFSYYDVSFMESYVTKLEALIDRQIRALSMNYYYYYHFNEKDKISIDMSKYIDNWLKNNPISILERPLLLNNRF